MTQPNTGARPRAWRERVLRSVGRSEPVAERQVADTAIPDTVIDDTTVPDTAVPEVVTADAAMDQSDGTGGDGAPLVLPPGQYVPRTLPVLHYGPIPSFRPDRWDLKIMGATESGAVASLRWADIEAMPVTDLTADFHCVTKFTVPAVRWAGIAATEILRRFPPEAAVTHVMIWAEYGYSANIRITDFAAETTVLATQRDGVRLTAEHGYPLRLVVPHLYAWKSVKWIRALEYLTSDRRGFWEERGYHNTADPWREQRYSYQEQEGEGPPL